MNFAKIGGGLFILGKSLFQKLQSNKKEKILKKMKS